MRTTIDLDPQVLRQLKTRQRREGKTLGQLASELLARALGEEDTPAASVSLNWPVRSMGALVDIEDKDALHRVLDGDAGT
ncbi:MAG: antitoxin [Micromonosporaceae bacterium]|nr:antitoxin [Micromonosporaceae bacterium]